MCVFLCVIHNIYLVTVLLSLVLDKTENTQTILCVCITQDAKPLLGIIDRINETLAQ